MQLVMHTLSSYEVQSGQKINKGKSFFYVHSKIAGSIVQDIEGVTGFNKGKFPLLTLDTR